MVSFIILAKFSKTIGTRELKMFEIELKSGQKLKFPIKYSKKRRSIAIKVDAKGAISLYAPARVSLQYLEDFVNTRLDWIEKHHLKNKSTHQSSPLEAFEKRAGHVYFKGHQRTLVFEIIAKDNERMTLFDKGERIRFQVNDDHATEENKENEEKQLIIMSKCPVTTQAIYTAYKKWMKSEAQLDFDSRLKYWSEQMNLNYQSLEIKAFTRRWGDCSSKQIIRMNWKNMACSKWVRDSLCIHELAHLQEMNHSAKFYQLVRSHDLHERKAHHWLKRHAFILEY